MALLYLESSALFKRYRQEIGTEVLDQVFEDVRPGETIVTSAFTSVEISATARRLLKGHLLRQSRYIRILFRFADDLDRHIALEPVTEQIIAGAKTVAQVYALRAGDALQLATALEVKALHPLESLIFITADRELYDAAEAAGLGCVDPESPTALGRLRLLRER